MTGPDAVLSPHQVADELGVNYETVLRMIHRQELAGVKRGNKYYIRRSAVEAFLTPKAEASTASARAS